VGSGISGLLHVQLARSTGAARVIAVDINPGRMEAALRVGADAVLIAGENLPDRLQNINEGRLADLVIVATGAVSALAQAFRAVDRGGTILFFAPSDPGACVQLPFNELWRKEVTMTSSYAGSPRDIRSAIELIASQRVDVTPMITHRLPLAMTQEGFRLVSEAGGNSMKVVVEPQK